MDFWYYSVHKAPGLEKEVYKKVNLKFSIQFDVLIDSNFLTKVNFSSNPLCSLYLLLPNLCDKQRCCFSLPTLQLLLRGGFVIKLEIVIQMGRCYRLHSA